MTYEEYKYKWLGKGIDFDGYYGFQCADNSEEYNRDVIGANRIGGNAKDAVNNYDRSKYTYIKNTPTGIPTKGDIVVWGAMPGNPYGHIAIFDNGNVNQFVSLDQNFPVGSIVHLQPHNYNYVLGWLHPIKNPNTSTPVPLTDTQKVSKIRDLLNQSLPAEDFRNQTRTIINS